MSDDASGENQQFEDMLHRLDALMKRNQADEAQHYEFDLEPPPPDAAPATPPLASQEDIPVLTDVYEGSAAPTPAVQAGLADAEALRAMLSPVIEDIVQEEAARLRRALAERLPQALAAALRQQREHDQG